MVCYSIAGSQRFVSQCSCHDGLSHQSCLVAVAVIRRRSDVFSALGTTAARRQIGAHQAMSRSMTERSSDSRGSAASGDGITLVGVSAGFREGMPISRLRRR